jgi:hypothetical protein
MPRALALRALGHAKLASSYLAIAPSCVELAPASAPPLVQAPAGCGTTFTIAFWLYIDKRDADDTHAGLEAAAAAEIASNAAARAAHQERSASAGTTTTGNTSATSTSTAPSTHARRTSLIMADMPPVVRQSAAGIVSRGAEPATSATAASSTSSSTAAAGSAPMVIDMASLEAAVTRAVLDTAVSGSSVWRLV